MDPNGTIYLQNIRSEFADVVLFKIIKLNIDCYYTKNTCIHIVSYVYTESSNSSYQAYYSISMLVYEILLLHAPFSLGKLGLIKFTCTGI